MEYWITRYANNQAIDKDAARKLLRNVNTKHWELTLKQFEAKAKSGGYESELDAEYFRSRVARLQDLEKQLKFHTREFANQQVVDMQQELTKQCDDTYMRTTFNIQMQTAAITANFARFNEQQLKVAVSKPWAPDGKDFSQRIWKNYTEELPSFLMDAVLRGTLLGYGPQRISKMFYARFQDVKRNDIHRLVISEMAHVAEEATAMSYEENHVERYKYMATLESHTCGVCGKLDYEIFDFADRKPGVNYPLIHPRCRCTTSPWVEEPIEGDMRWMRDPATGKGKRIRTVKFDEWKKLMKQQQLGQSLETRAVRMPQKSSGYEWNELNAEQYNKHVKDTPEFKNYAKGRNSPISELLVSPDEATQLINRYGRRGPKSERNQIQFNAEDYIGKWADVNGDLYPTKKGRISYRKNKGAHITPLKPDYLK